MRGDREAFGVLVVHTSDRLYAIATRILRDTELAEDALQRRPPHRVAPAPHPSGPGSLRCLGPAPARPRLLRRGQASAIVGGKRAGPAGRRAGRPRHDGLRHRPRRARSGVPTPDDRTARGLRPAPPRGPALGRDRRNARHPGRHGPLATALRDQSAARGRRGRRRARSSPKDGWHDRRTTLRPISRAWLDLMPDEAPDRAVQAVLQAVETTPQVRPWRRLPWRSTPMNRLPLRSPPRQLPSRSAAPAPDASRHGPAVRGVRRRPFRHRRHVSDDSSRRVDPGRAASPLDGWPERSCRRRGRGRRSSSTETRLNSRSRPTTTPRD